MLWGELEDRRETLRLLALIAQTQPNVKIRGLDGYQPPSETLAEELEEAE